MLIKALTIRLPWAYFIINDPGKHVMGRKTIEIRTWHTHYRGPIAIHVGKTLDPEAWEQTGEYCKFLIDQSWRGKIVAIANLTDIVKYETVEAFDDDMSWHLVDSVGYEPGIFGWKLRDIRKLETPITWRGMPGLFEVEILNV